MGTVTLCKFVTAIYRNFFDLFQDRLTVFQNLATLYIKYIQIFRKLESSYDQVCVDFILRFA